MFLYLSSIDIYQIQSFKNWSEIMQNSSIRLDFNHHASPWNYILRVNLDNIEILSQQNETTIDITDYLNINDSMQIIQSSCAVRSTSLKPLLLPNRPSHRACGARTWCPRYTTIVRLLSSSSEKIHSCYRDI